MTVPLPTFGTVPVTSTRRNTDQEVIEITTDKLSLILSNHRGSLENRRGWLAPLGVLLTLVATLITAEFRDSLGLAAHTWSAIFVIAAALSTIWLVRSLLNLVRSVSLDDLVNKIREGDAGNLR